MFSRFAISALLVFAAILSSLSCAHVAARSGSSERGRASWYGPGLHGRKTASGERFNMYALTAAHRTLPMNSVVKVRSLSSGASVSVRINDRGPFAKGRIIDLSYQAARKLGMLKKGEDEVEIEIVSVPSP